MAAHARISFDPAELAAFKFEATHGRPYAARVSGALALQLSYNYAMRLDFWPVLDELDFLENRRQTSKTKPATRLTAPPLTGFWHKHYWSPRHLMHNLGDNWCLNRSPCGNAKFDALINELVQGYAGDPGRAVADFAHRFVVEGFERRAGRTCIRRREARLTGDWIIFKFHEGERFYLALATHDEGEHPKSLYERLARECAAEFPFLFVSGLG